MKEYLSLEKQVMPITLMAIVLVLVGCGQKGSKEQKEVKETKGREDQNISVVDTVPPIETPTGMVWIPGGEFVQGASESDKMAMPHEKPAHRVLVNGFYMDKHEVTNAQFATFVEETGYVTVAEREIEWEEMKKQLPEGTPKPHDSILQPGSLLFKKTKSSVPNLYHYSQWWQWGIGTIWKHPTGPVSTIE